jgi:hypothetical protein
MVRAFDGCWTSEPEHGTWQLHIIYDAEHGFPGGEAAADPQGGVLGDL